VHLQHDANFHTVLSMFIQLLGPMFFDLTICDVLKKYNDIYLELFTYMFYV